MKKQTISNSEENTVSVLTHTISIPQYDHILGELPQ
jgi:hypothetical protein